MRTVKDKEGNFHRIDRAGNHFINKKCINTKSWEEDDETEEHAQFMDELESNQDG